MPKLRIAAIGAGYFSQFHYEAWSRMIDAECVGVCDIDSARANEVAKRWSIPHAFCDPVQMIERLKPDLLDIITPPQSHLPLIKLAAENRINVICQKAFCHSLAEAINAVQIAEQHGILLVVHENFRFQPWYAEIKQQLDSGKMGQIYQATFRLRPGDGQGPDPYSNRQPYFQKMKRFLVHETGIHFVDIFRFLFGEVGSVFADLRRLNPAIAGEDAGIIIFCHRNGVRSLFDGNRLLDHPAKNHRLTMGEMLIEGEHVTLRLDGDGQLYRRARGFNEWNLVPLQWNDAGFAGDSVYRLQRHVIDHLLDKGPIMNVARDYIVNLLIEAAIYKSAEQSNFQEIEAWSAGLPQNVPRDDGAR